MHQNRIRGWLTETRVVSSSTPASLASFAVCPQLLMQPEWQPIYQAAFEQAVASTRPSLLERAQRITWN